MIQRKQSLFLVLVILTAAVLIFWLPLFHAESGPRYIIDDWYFALGFLLSGLLALLSLLKYKTRRTQLVLGRLNIIVSFVLFASLLYFWYETFSANPAQLGLGVFVPLINVILLSLANRGIVHDEMLVRAADRFR